MPAGPDLQLWSSETVQALDAEFCGHDSFPGEREVADERAREYGGGASRL
jgi:hypothetical protein